MAVMLASSPPPSSQLPPTPIPSSPSSISSRSFPRSARTAPSRPLHASSHATTHWSFEQRMQESLYVLDLMESQSIPPDPSLFCTLLKACSDEGSLQFGKTIHQRVLQYGLQHDPFVANSLIAMYGKCGLLGVARQLFDEMPVKNVVSWTTAISMYHHAGFPCDALDLYRLMRGQALAGVKPNAFTYTITLNSCAKVGNLEMGVEVHEDIKRDGCHNDEFIVAALIDMYAKCGCVSEARAVFDAAGNPTAVAWTALIEGLNSNGESIEAMQIFRRITHLEPDMKFLREVGLASVIKSCIMEMAIRQGQEIHAHIIKSGNDPGPKSMSHLVELYEKCNKVVIAYRIFNGLTVKNVHLWSKMVAGFARNGLYREALEVYSDMVSADVGSNPLAVSWVLKSCTELERLEDGKQIHGRVIKVCSMVLEDSVVDALIELYGNCGEHEAANKVTKNRRKHVSH